MSCKLRFPLFALLAVISNSIYANSIELAVGNYNTSATSHSGFLPLILNKDTENNIWNYNTNIHDFPGYPEAISTTLVENGTCNDTSCIIVGEYGRKGTTEWLPLILQSNDHGKNWNFIANITNLPKDFGSPGDMYTSGCFEQSCLIVSSYLSEENGMRPLMMQSKDSGRSWQFINLDKFYPKHSQSQVNHAICHDKLCVASGYYYNYKNNTSHLVILRSEDAGATWSNQIKLDFNNIDFNLFNTVSYNNNKFFITTTQYDSQSNTYLPSILTSQDNGKTWTKNTNISGLPAKETIHQLGIQKMTCHGATCVIGGGYWRHEHDIQQPLIIISHDNGLTWKVNSALKNLPSLFNASVISSANYSDKKWFLNGGYSTTTHDSLLPLILKSEDDGDTWNFVTPTTAQTLDYGFIEDITCGEKNCAAVGMKFENNVAKPMLFESFDGGWYWQASKLNMPSDIAKGNVRSLLGAEQTGRGNSTKTTLTTKLLNQS